MKVEYELQVSGVGYPVEYVREGISYPLIQYATGYCLAIMAISAALSRGYPVNRKPTSARQNPKQALKPHKYWNE